MTSESAPALGCPRGRRWPLAALTGLGLFTLVAVAGLTWAKWWPYSHRVAALVAGSGWGGGSVLDAGRPTGAAPSWDAGVSFVVAYGRAVWKALVAALLVAAALEALLPVRWLLRALAGRGRLGGALAGGLFAVPCMMCTCCTAPLTASLRRRGVPTSSALAYWVGNPTLNPAALVFLALVGPWQWTATRLVVGALLVFGVSTLVSRLAPRSLAAEAVGAAGAAETFTLRGSVGRFAGALGRMTVTLVPEYAAVVLAVGALRGWLFPLDGSAASWGLAGVLAASVLGTLVVIPTAGEIPVLLALAAAGVAPATLGALLLVLPAVSLPSMLMVGRALSWRVTAAMGAAVVGCGLLAGVVLTVLG